VPRKSPHSALDLPALELECMKALWALNEATVEEIRAQLFPHRPLAYTTVLTVMDRLARKGVAERRKRGRAHVYTSAVPADSVRDFALQRLVENFFAGSREQLRAHLSEPPAGKISLPRPPEPPQPRPAAARRTPRKSKTLAPPPEGLDSSLL
jgi:BlaI family transcriptional regulator, penicillinase repressor